MTTKKRKQRTPPKTDELVILTTPELMALFGVKARSTFTSWKKADPEFAAANYERGVWDGKRAVDWWIENIIGVGPEGEKEPDVMKDARAVYWQAKARKMEVDADRASGAVADWSAIETEWAKRWSLVGAGLQSLIDRLPPLLEGLDRAQMRAAIEDEVREIRDGFAAHGDYTPKPKGG